LIHANIEPGVITMKKKWKIVDRGILLLTGAAVLLFTEEIKRQDNPYSGGGRELQSRGRP
jgi:hypothetical protein